MAKMENNYKIVLQIGFRGHNFLQYPEQSNCNVTDWKHRGHGSHSCTDWLKKSERDKEPVKHYKPNDKKYSTKS